MTLDDTMVCRVTGGPNPGSLKVHAPDGQELRGVISVEVPHVRANTMVRAKIEMLVSVDTLVQPLINLEFVKAAAKLHGFKLVRAATRGQS